MQIARYGSRDLVWGVILCVTMAACTHTDTGSGKSSTGGTLVISTAAEADYLFPPLTASSAGLQITAQIFEHLAEVGDTLNVMGDGGFSPQLADRWDWAPDSLSIAFHLNPHARWHDGVPVTAKDVQFTVRLFKDPALASPSAPLVTDIDSVSIRDSLTPVFWFTHRSPHQFYDAAGQMLILPAHVYGTVPASALASSALIRTPVGSGRFRFVRWIPGSTIEIATNSSHYRGRALLDRVIWTISPDFSAASTKLLTGEADFFEAMRPENVVAAARIPTLRIATYPSFDYAFVLFNLRDPKTHARPHPLFGDRAVRRALTMAVDRVSIAANVLDSLGSPSVGPAVRAMPTTDTTLAQIPYDPAAAAKTLDSLGWRMGPDSIRVRGGRPLAFTVITPTSSKNRERCAVLLQAQLRKVGVHVDIQPLEVNAFIQQEAAHTFDAAMQAWHLDPSPAGVQQIWSTAAAEGKTGTNYGAYTNPLFDAQIDSALAAPTLVTARPLFTHAYTTIIGDAAGIWLYEPKGVVGVHRRVHLQVLRPDAWWAHVADWSVPASERIARDRMPVRGE